mgnify:CR=1 FL=1
MRIPLIIGLLCLLTSLKAQEAFTIKYYGLSIHPGGDPTAHLQPFRLDDEAKYVMNFGGFVGYEKFIYEDLVSLKVIQGLMADCSAGLASVSHVGIRGRIFDTKKHRLYLGIGPTLLVRDSWNRFGDKYTSSGYLNEYTSRTLGELQWKLVPYGFEFEYDYKISLKDHLSISITPAPPLALLTSIGWKHWIEIKEFPSLKIYTPKRKK